MFGLNYEFLLLCMAAFFTVVNPISIMPVFLSMTTSMTEQERIVVARKGVLVAVLVMIFFGFTSELIFSLFGISINGLRVAGGIIFFFMGFDMLHARVAKAKVEERDIHKMTSTEALDMAVSPLGIPLICGPGAIANTIVLMKQADSWGSKGIVLLTILVVGYVTYFVLINSSSILKVIGVSGSKVITKIMGLILMVIAVEIFFVGVKPYIQDILKIQ